MTEPAALLGHRGKQRAAEQEQRADVDAQHAVDDRGGHVGGGQPRRGGGVVDEDVDAPEQAQRLLRHALRRIGVRQVGFEHDRIVRQFCGDGREQLTVARDERDACSRAIECPGGGGADPAACPGDERGAAGELSAHPAPRSASIVTTAS